MVVNRYIIPVLLLASGFLAFGSYIYGRSSSPARETDFTECHRTFDLLDQGIDCAKLEEVGGRVGTLEKKGEHLH